VVVAVRAPEPWALPPPDATATTTAPTGTLSTVPVILLATDASWIHDEIDVGLSSPDTTVLRVRAGQDVLPAVLERQPDLVILDLQIGNMGGVAACLALRQEEGMNRLERRPILLLLDRHADVFLARTSGADGWMIKPIDGFRVGRAVRTLLAGGQHFEGAAPAEGAAHTEAGESAELAS
jgi:DNA-binding response OmpR family regulator